MARKHRFKFISGDRGIPVCQSPVGITLIVRDAASNKAKPWRVLALRLPCGPTEDVVNPQTSLEKAKFALDAWVSSGGTVRS